MLTMHGTPMPAAPRTLERRGGFPSRLLHRYFTTAAERTKPRVYVQVHEEYSTPLI
jgi:hypothetical protein